MSFELLLCCVIALYAVLNFVVLPRCAASWNANRLISKVAKAGILSGVQFLRDVCFLASVLYLCLALLTTILRFGYFGNVEFLKRAVASASRLHESFESVSDFWDHWFFLLPVALLAFLQWETQRKDFSNRFQRHVDEELDRLNEERSREPQRWNQFEADEKMRSFDQQIAKTQASLRDMNQNGSKERTERRRLLRQLVAIKEARTEWDYQRRICLDRLDVHQTGPDAQSVWRRVLLSKGLFSDLKGLSQILSRATLCLLTVALIGVAGNAGVTKELEERVIHLDDLRVEARKEEAKESWEKRLQAARQRAPQSVQNQADSEAIHQLANDFGRALARNPNWQAIRASAQREEHFERAVARRAILNEVRLPDADGHSRVAFASGLNNREAEILQATVSASDPRTGHYAGNRIGQIIEQNHGPEVKSWFGEKWAKVQAAIQQHAQAYSEPVSTDDLQGELIDRIVAVAFDATEPTGATDWMKQARDGLSDATKEAVRETVDTEFESFLNDLSEGKSYEESVKRVRSDDIPIAKGKVEEIAAVMHDRNLPDRRDFDDRMASTPGEWQDRDSPNHPPFSGSGGVGPTGSGGGGPAELGAEALSKVRMSPQLPVAQSLLPLNRRRQEAHRMRKRS